MRLVEGKKGELSKWLCGDCNQVHALPYEIGRSRGQCYACQAVRRKKLTGKQPDSPGKPAKRTCLMCGKRFDSADINNRRCAQCEYKLQHDPVGKHSNKKAMRFAAAGKMFEASYLLEG